MMTQLFDENAHLQMKRRSNQTEMTYTAYGLHTVSDSTTPTLAYNGEFQDTLSQLYLLGNGHRPYNSRLMRFNTPDAQSPFSLGGINSYCYCIGDPINFSDPSGKTRTPLRPANTLQRRHGGNPTLRESSRLRQREALLKRQASLAGANARRDARAARDLAKFAEKARAAINSTNDAIHRQIYSAVADLNQQQRSYLVAHSADNRALKLSFLKEAERLARTRTALLLTEYENVPLPQVNPPDIPVQVNQVTTVPTLATSIRRTTVRGVNS
ncbi:RHS repeat-associated core domain-containing protein [Pseudomonas asiatica]|uniref:RHS repeat-associated core domain-containing protein n=1 Tax=Pseudomonas asiatica TaxID=2219225 RepID=UPI002DB5775E|nr:RHS repeat-associated core domain-containing protein [Pseudomonas asiatica]